MMADFRRAFQKPEPEKIAATAARLLAIRASTLLYKPGRLAPEVLPFHDTAFPKKLTSLPTTLKPSCQRRQWLNFLEFLPSLLAHTICTLLAWCCVGPCFTQHDHKSKESNEQKSTSAAFTDSGVGQPPGH
jgi:hypothetical protein